MRKTGLKSKIAALLSALMLLELLAGCANQTAEPKDSTAATAAATAADPTTTALPTDPTIPKDTAAATDGAKTERPVTAEPVTTVPQTDTAVPKDTTAATDGAKTDRPVTTEPVTTVPQTEQKVPDNVCEYANKDWNGKTLRVLAIGNSFSEDATTYLYGIAKAEGVENVVVGNLYIGGCTLDTHASNAKNNKNAYKYFKADASSGGKFVERADTSLLYAIKDEDWDIITMQQASGSSGQPSTYNTPLKYLISYVNENKTNPDCKIAWHMTWAYQSDSTHSAFANYKNSQLEMYKAIVNAVKTAVIPTDAFSIIIPSGTAVQDIRTGYFGDRVTRDGYHLNESARFLAGYVWYSSLTGKIPDGIKYNPATLSLSDNDLALILESVKNSLESPFETVDSVYTEKPTFDLSGYTEFTYDFTPCAYWNSTDSGLWNTVIASAGNSKFFYATELFDKETLPVGTVIILDDGWQYRPEAWANSDAQSSRPGVVTNNVLVITESFWDGYRYRAFNLSAAGAGKDLTNEKDVASHMRFYFPTGKTVPDKKVTFESDPLPEIDLSDYEKLDLTLVRGYWNATEATLWNEIISTAGNSKFFVATERFTRESLPVGSVIVVDDGWQYRPEAWKGDSRLTSARPGVKKSGIVVVTEDWWADYTSRAFNISLIGSSTEITDVSEAASHFGIYIPKKQS